MNFKPNFIYKTSKFKTLSWGFSEEISIFGDLSISTQQVGNRKISKKFSSLGKVNAEKYYILKPYLT